VTKHDAHTPLSAGYELGAETPQEAAEFADVASALALDVTPIEPPAALKASIMAKLSSTPQLAPTATDEAPLVLEKVEPSVVGTAPEPQKSPSIAPAGPAETRARSRWFARPAVILVAAAAALVLFFGGLAVGTSVSNSNSVSQQAAALVQINAAADAQHAHAPVAGGGTASLVWSDSLAKSVVVVNGVPQLPNGKTYQLWYIRNGEATSAGTMTVAASGPTSQALEGSIASGDTVAMTVEPSGGSKQPTTKPIMAIRS
jgi:anti-sigma-K factor RskA